VDLYEAHLQLIQISNNNPKTKKKIIQIMQIQNMNEIEDSNKNRNKKVCKIMKQHPNMLDKMKINCSNPMIWVSNLSKFWVDLVSSGRHRNTGQHRLYEFCYLLAFDLWTSYLARILFLKGCGSLFWESPNSPKIFNGLQHSFQVWQEFINVQNLFLTRIPYSS
jgi:hypothetical protein